jgi:putative phosphonate catabolism associated alcohol dehydrogenase
VSLLKYGHERIRRGWELSGGFATHTHLRARTPLVRVAERLPAAVLAPAACATATVMAALGAASAIRPLEGATVAVSGCGMLGLTAVAAARAAGAVVVAADPDPRRRELATRFGAITVADGSRDGLRAALVAARARAGLTIGIEVSGAPAAIGALLASADIGAVVVLVGSVFPAGTVPIDPEAVVRRMLTVRGVHNYAPEHLLQAVRFLETAADRDAFAALVGAPHPLDAVEEALREARAGAAARVALAPHPRPVEVRG